MDKGSTIEILEWKSKSGVTDSQMIRAVDAMVGDIQTLKGFLNQSLYKDSSGNWVDIYYWESELDAHNSNESMANKESFKQLIELIEPESVTIEVMPSLQQSGNIVF